MFAVTAQLLAFAATDWELFWAETWRDLIVTVIVGGLLAAAVGFALSRWQSSVEARQQERLSLASWDIVRPKFRVLAVHSLHRSPFGEPKGSASTESDLRDLRDLAESVPIALWADAASENLELRALRDLLVEYPSFASFGDEVLARIEGALLMADPSLMLDSKRLKGARTEACRYLADPSDVRDSFAETLTAFTESVMHVNLDSVREERALAAEVAKQDRVVAAWSEYVEAHSRVVDIHDQLRRALGHS